MTFSEPDATILLRDELDAKFQVYTLACRRILEHYADLFQACDSEGENTRDEVFDVINEQVAVCMRNKAATDWSRVFDHVVAQLNAAATGQAQRRLVADVLSRIAAAIGDAGANPANWNGLHDLRTYHSAAHQIAANYFESSHVDELRARSTRVAHLRVDSSRKLILQSRNQRSIGFQHAHMSTLRGTTPGTDRVTYYFDLDHDFHWYRSLVYKFLHEYTAHVMPVTSVSERFNEGWMLYVADRLLADAASGLEIPGVLRAHGDAFFETMLTTLPRFASENYLLAERMYHLLASASAHRFHWLTYELAAFAPTHAQGPLVWHNGMLQLLRRAYDTDPRRLRQQVEDAPDAAELYRMLQGWLA